MSDSLELWTVERIDALAPDDKFGNRRERLRIQRNGKPLDAKPT